MRGWFLNSKGFSLVEVMVVVGIMGISTLAMMSMHTTQLKANNYLEFQLKRTQLQGTIINQFLNDPNNCKCLFNGAVPYPVAGTNALSGVSPTQVGTYHFATAGVCATASMPSPFVNNLGIDGLKTTSIKLENISPTADPNIYSGRFNINVQSSKEVLGPRDLPISIPVNIATSPAGANVKFLSCSLSSNPTTGSMTNPGYVIFPNGLIMQWGSLNFATSSAYRYMSTVTFPIPFPHQVLSVTASLGASTGGPLQCFNSNGVTPGVETLSTTLTSAVLYSDDGGVGSVVSSSHCPFTWTAIGF